MKNLLKLGMALLVVAVLIGFVGCFDTGDEDVDVDFKNYTGSDRAIAFRNATSYNVVLFGKTLEEKNKLGGVSASSLNGSGISKAKNTAFFSSTQAFEVIAITEDQYKKGNLKSIEYPLTRLYVFYNKDGENNNIYDISDVLGSNQCFITITLPVNGGWNVELRNGGTGGAAIGYAAQGMISTRLYVQPEVDLNLFPVFHRWNNFQEVLEVAYPKNSSGDSVHIGLALTKDNPEFVLNMRSILDGLKNTKPNVGAAYVAIQCSVTGGMVQLTRNDIPIRSPLGVAYFTGPKTFQINMQNIGGPASANFADSADFSGYKIGPLTHEKNIRFVFDDGDRTTASVENGKIYTLTVSGDATMDPAGITNAMYFTTTGVGSVKEFDWGLTE